MIDMIAKTIIRSILEIIGIDKIKKERKIKKACALLQDVGGEALQAYYDVASELSIIFVPIFGTLLGIYRNHDFIPHDDDIDMALDIRSLSDNLLISLKKHGFEFSNIFVASDFKGCQLPMKFKGLTCDIYFSYIDVNSQSHIFLPLAITGHDWLFSSNMNLFRAKDVVVPYETSTMAWKFRNKEIKIPLNSVEILKTLYGKDFMTPKKNAHADPNVYQTPLYERNFRSIPIEFCKESNFWEQIIKVGRY
jgi:hypothetical protein